MLKSELKPLAAKRKLPPLAPTQKLPLAPTQKLSPVDPTIAATAGAVLGVCATVSGNFLSKWVWAKYQQKRKQKAANVPGLHMPGAFHVVNVETVECVVKRRRVRVTLRHKG